MVLSGLYPLLKSFPDRAFSQEYQCLRPCMAREDTPPGSHCLSMRLPGLRERRRRRRTIGQVQPEAGKLFSGLSWFYVFCGIGWHPERHDPLAAAPDAPQFSTALARDGAVVLSEAPSHRFQFLGSTRAAACAGVRP